MITVNKATDDVKLRKCKIVEGSNEPYIRSYTPFAVDEEKPGYKAFDILWDKDGGISTFQVTKIHVNKDQPNNADQ